MSEFQEKGEIDDFATRLSNLRRAAGLSQPGLGKASGVPVSTIRTLEQRRSDPSWVTLNVLAKALGASLGDFDGCKIVQSDGESE